MHRHFQILIVTFLLGILLVLGYYYGYSLPKYNEKMIELKQQEIKVLEEKEKKEDEEAKEKQKKEEEVKLQQQLEKESLKAEDNDSKKANILFEKKQSCVGQMEDIKQMLTIDFEDSWIDFEINRIDYSPSLNTCIVGLIMTLQGQPPVIYRVIDGMSKKNLWQKVVPEDDNTNQTFKDYSQYINSLVLE